MNPHSNCKRKFGMGVNILTSSPTAITKVGGGGEYFAVIIIWTFIQWKWKVWVGFNVSPPQYIELPFLLQTKMRRGCQCFAAILILTLDSIFYRRFNFSQQIIEPGLRKYHFFFNFIVSTYYMTPERYHGFRTLQN